MSSHDMSSTKNLMAAAAAPATSHSTTSNASSYSFGDAGYGLSGVTSAVSSAPAPVKPLPWYRQPSLRKLYALNIILFLGSTSLGYDASLLNSLQSITSWQAYFDYPTSSRLGIFGAMAAFGCLFVLLFASYIADGLGRRLGAAVGSLVVILGALLQCFPPADNPEPMYLAGRFILGMGAYISNACCPLLITELAHPQHRGELTTLYNTLFYLGAIIAAWTSYGSLQNQSGNMEWRLPTGIQCIMPGIQLSLIWLLPESPRWLIAKGKYQEALGVLVEFHGNGNANDEFVKWEFAEIQQTIELEQEALKNGWLDLFHTPGNRKRCALIVMTAIFSQCSGNGLFSYYLSPVLNTVGITDPIDQSLINGGLTIWCFLVSVGSAFLVDRVGRRFLFLVAGLGMLFAYTVWTACSAVYAQSGSQTLGSAIISMIFVFYGFAGLAWPGLTVSYTVEILPFQIRAKGLTLCFCFTALSQIFNLYVNPIGLEALGWKFYLVYVAFLVVECAAIYFFYLETRGHTLEEIALLFDGTNAPAAHAKAGAKETLAAFATESSATDAAAATTTTFSSGVSSGGHLPLTTMRGRETTDDGATAYT